MEKSFLADKNKKKNKITALKVLKHLGLILAVCLVYGASCYFKGFKETTLKFASLFLYCFIGIFLFFIVYYTSNFISVVVYKSKKKKSKNVVNCDEKLNDVLSSSKYKFSYEKAKTPSQNLKGMLAISKNLTVDIASSYGNKGRYNLLNFTVYDALSVTDDFLRVLQGKIERVLDVVPFIDLKEKPIGFLEKTLNKALNNEEEKPKEKKSGFLGSVLTKVAVPMLKGQIDKEANEFILWIGSESFRVFGKNGKKYKPLNSEEVEVVYD